MPVPTAISALPIGAALPALAAALARERNVVLHAPPGAGKSTGVPLALLDAPWLGNQRIVMLEPRRLAARAVASRMATLLGEAVGETVGYRMRLDTRVGPRTRIEVVTEGILTRQMQRDPALDGIGCVIFDEYHERSLQADLGLALTLDCQRHLREDLRLLVMSATLDTAAVARLLDTKEVVTSAGLSHPVTTRYLPRTPEQLLERLASGAVLSSLREDTGDILVFLPGAGEIRRVEEILTQQPLPAGTTVYPLHGELSAEIQDRAIQPASAGQRKVVLATNIAETSLTIEGVRVVIDAGLERRSRFYPGSGMSRLETVRISRASADQRRGRAGRLGPGVCHRLWTETDQRALKPHTPAEILEADLAPLALDLAAWGTEASALAWLDAPPAATLAQARDLLGRLQALGEDGRINAHGREMARLSMHPRLAHLLLRAKEAGIGATGCALAALLGERDILRGRERDADIRLRLELLAGRPHPDADMGGLRRARRTAEFFRRQLGTADTTLDIDAAGWLLGCAYPDRIGRMRAGQKGHYQLSGGRGACFATPQALASSEFIVIADLDAGEREARIFLAAPLNREEIETRFPDEIVTEDRIAWDAREQLVTASRRRRLGELTLDEARLAKPDADAVLDAMIEGLRAIGLDALPWTPALRSWQARVMLLRSADTGAREPWPDVSDAALLGTIGDWLSPWLDGVMRREHLARIDLGAALRARLSYEQQRRLEELAPTHIEVPSGSHIALDYLDGTTPSLSVRLQEVFGLQDTPRIAGGRVPVMMKLLSPARRPVQVTQDLKSFWERGYHEVRKELKGRYPRHYWPEDPYQAEATRRVRPR